MRVEVAVVGGGVVGASVAYHLAARGCRDVLVLEREGPGAGSTGRPRAARGRCSAARPT